MQPICDLWKASHVVCIPDFYLISWLTYNIYNIHILFTFFEAKNIIVQKNNSSNGDDAIVFFYVIQ